MTLRYNCPQPRLLPKMPDDPRMLNDRTERGVQLNALESP